MTNNLISSYLPSIPQSVGYVAGALPLGSLVPYLGSLILEPESYNELAKAYSLTAMATIAFEADKKPAYFADHTSYIKTEIQINLFPVFLGYFQNYLVNSEAVRAYYDDCYSNYQEGHYEKASGLHCSLFFD
jgi:hypothetical protein